MKSAFLMSVAAAAIVAGAMALPAVSAAQVPPMSGGYSNIIAIPIDESIPIGMRKTKAIAGALIKPEGAGPFPAVIYLGGCAPIGSPHDADLEKTLIDHNRAKGFATLIVDSYTPRHAEHGMCDNIDDHRWYFARAQDALGAWKALAANPDIDAKRIFVQAYSTGASSALQAIDVGNGSNDGAKFAGVIAFYPHCDFLSTLTVPALIMIGDKDELFPSGMCRQQIGKTNVEVVIYPGATHAFATPGVEDFEDHHMAYDPKVAGDAQARADAFIAAHMKDGSGS